MPSVCIDSFLRLVVASSAFPREGRAAESSPFSWRGGVGYNDKASATKTVNKLKGARVNYLIIRNEFLKLFRKVSLIIESRVEEHQITEIRSRFNFRGKKSQNCR